jgi:sulfur-oxidizing protein SoxY
MNIPRRTFLKLTLTSSAIAMGSLLLPVSVMAEWPKDAFSAKTVDDALTALFSTSETENSEKILIQTPDTAENGAVVPVTVNAELENVDSIAIIAEKNPIPLISKFSFSPNMVPYISTRVKMAGTGNILIVVKTTEGKLYTNRKEVVVTVGGCGG